MRSHLAQVAGDLAEGVRQSAADRQLKLHAELRFAAASEAHLDRAQQQATVADVVARLQQALGKRVEDASRLLAFTFEIEARECVACEELGLVGCLGVKALPQGRLERTDVQQHVARFLQGHAAQDPDVRGDSEAGHDGSGRNGTSRPALVVQTDVAGNEGQRHVRVAMHAQPARRIGEASYAFVDVVHALRRLRAAEVQTIGQGPWRGARRHHVAHCLADGRGACAPGFPGTYACGTGDGHGDGLGAAAPRNDDSRIGISRPLCGVALHVGVIVTVHGTSRRTGRRS